MIYIGVDVGGMSIKVGFVGEDGSISRKDSFVTRVGVPAEDVIKQLADFIEGMLKKSHLTKDEVMGIGLGIPGSVFRGVVKHANNLHWDNVPVVKLLSEYLGFHDDLIYAENDANVAALGEMYFGCCQDVRNAVLVTLGTGVGTGIINDGNLLVGNGACGAEGGHMVISQNGLPCTCGRKGCWEVYASATALIRMAREAVEAYPDSVIAEVAAANGGVSGRTAFEAYRKGCKYARRVVKTYLRNVSIGIINLGNILRPEVIVIGGGISNQGEWFCRAIQEQVDAEAYGGEVNPRIIIKTATLGNDAGIIGAAALALHNNRIS